MTETTAEVVLDPGSFRFRTADLQAALAGVQADLAELRYVDGALAHLKELTGGNVHWPPGQRGASVDVTLGTKHPFTVTAEWADYQNWLSWTSWLPNSSAGGATRLENDLAEIAEQSRGWASTEMTFVREVLVQRYAVPESVAAYDRLDHDLAAVQRTLRHTIEDNFGNFRFLHTWRGKAADNFQTEFYEPFGKIREHQEEFVEAMRAAVQTSKILTLAKQYSLMNVLTAVGDALDEQLRLRSQGSHGDQSSTRDTLGLIGAGGAALSALSVKIRPLQYATALTSGTAMLGSEMLPEHNAAGTTGHIRIEANSADQMLEVLVGTIRELDRRLDVEYANFRDEVETLEEEVRQTRLYPKRPRLASGVDDDGDVQLVDPDEFHHESANRA